MLATQLIDTSLPLLHDTDSIGQALFLMQEHHVPVLAMSDVNGNFLGRIHEEILLDHDEDLLLAEFAGHETEIKILPEEHVFDVLTKSAMFQTSFIPVVDAQGILMGVIAPEKVVMNLARETAVKEPGGIIVVELKAINYSLAEMARIVESNNAVILHSFITQSSDTEKILVTLKINKLDLKEIILTFERFEYEIIAVFHVSEYEKGLQDRYDSLMMYLNV